ncbi:hypothetical protein [Nonlabens antarcticus]|uniref:hypothetical protein n=1 Tax=Nonlabens antarcticus TaxID=392714 RepID=UPI001891445F|nr:hypothetical protein [Nonlabens antarcticus]
MVPFYLAYSSHNKFGEEVIKDSGVFMVVDEVIQMEPFDNLYWDRLKLKEAMSDNFSITEFPGSLINKQFKESYWFGDNCKNKFTYFHAFFKNVMDVQK